MKPSILRNLLIGCVSFGAMMGCVFPFIAGFFVEWKEGMFGWFFAACLVAGVVSGSAVYGLVHLVLLKRLKIIAEVAEAISQNDISHECQMQSDDMIGEIIAAFNQMTANLRNMIGQISGATTQLAAAAEQTSTITDETSRGVQAQQAEIDSIAAAMNEMSGTVQEVARNAADASNAADAADTDSWWDGRPFDRILLDAPCSATGVIRRHPEIKWLRRPDQVDAAAQLQAELLGAMWPLLKPGGYLLYATCSVLKCENSDQVQHFLQQNDDAIEQTPAVEWGLAGPQGRQVLPGQAQMDGFYYAVLRKSA